VIHTLMENKTLGSSALLGTFISHLEDFQETDIIVGLEALKQAFPLMAVWSYGEKFFQQNGVEASSRTTFINEVRHGKEAVLTEAISTLSSFHSLLTISRSSLVEEVLLLLNRKKPIDVICSRSFPGREGEALRQILGQDGIKVCCVEDWQLLDKLADADAVVLGADLITDRFIVNKWGSAEIIRGATRLGKPVFVLAEPFKHLSIDSISKDSLYQDWTNGHYRRFIQVFECVSRKLDFSLIL